MGLKDLFDHIAEEMAVAKEKSIAKENAIAELRCQIESMLSDGAISEHEYEQLLQISKDGEISEGKVKEMIREIASKVLHKKLKIAAEDFNISEKEYNELWKYAQSAKLTKMDFDDIIAECNKECLMPYVMRMLETKGKLRDAQLNEIYSMGDKAHFSRKETDAIISESKKKYQKKKAEMRKQRLLRYKKYLVIGGISIGAIMIIALCSYEIYCWTVKPSMPKELSIAPNPMFVLDDKYLFGEVSGIFESKDMPKNAKLVISPYLEVENSHYYGKSVMYVGEDVVDKNKDAVVVPYLSGRRFNQPFRIENPTYGKDMNLYIRFDAYYNGKKTILEDKCFIPVWDHETLRDEINARLDGPETLALVFGILSGVLLIIILLFIFTGFFSSIFAFCTIPLLVIFVLLTYFPARKCREIEAEGKLLRKQYDNAIYIYKHHTNKDNEKSIEFDPTMSDTEEFETIISTDDSIK